MSFERQPAEPALTLERKRKHNSQPFSRLLTERDGTVRDQVGCRYDARDRTDDLLEVSDGGLVSAAQPGRQGQRAHGSQLRLGVTHP